MIHIDNLDGEGTIFITTDYDGTKSIGHVEEEYVDVVQDALKELKRLREEMRRLYDAWFDDEGMSQDAHETLMTELFVELMG